MAQASRMKLLRGGRPGELEVGVGGISVGKAGRVLERAGLRQRGNSQGESSFLGLICKESHDLC